MKRPLSRSLALLLSLAVLAACTGSGRNLRSPWAGTLRDGSYLGSAFIFPVKVRVRLKVAGSRIESLELLQHFNGQGKAAEALLPRVVESQSLELEAVSGATHSSRTILKAIEDALSKAQG